MGASIEAARAAFAQRSWGAAYEGLAAAADELGAEDLQRLAVAAHLVGQLAASHQAWERAHLRHLEAGDGEAAARCATWLAILLMLGGETPLASGWFARAERVLAEVEGSCAARGFLLMPRFFEALGSGDLDGADQITGDMLAVGRACRDADLLALAVLSSGEVRIARGEMAAGMRLLDEAMVSVTAGEVSPIPAGIVYCAVIEACRDALDVRRATAWTQAFQSWCDSQPDLVPFRGQCLVHRSELLQARGALAEAAAEAARACELLADPVHPALGAAHYQRGEVQRILGDAATAERAYRAAHEHGRDPNPGLALLRLAAGDHAAATAAIRGALDAGDARGDRPAVLVAAVEVFLAAGDVGAARAASDGLSTLASEGDVSALDGYAAGAQGAVLEAEGDVAAALTAHRRALAVWLDLDMAYQAARARVGVARACAALGDADSAALELDAARTTFERVGAHPEAARLVGHPARAGGALPLTERERSVLREVAAGQTNREVAASLGISEHTVARHLQNIFTKTGATSRTAATAYAYEHGLV